MLRLEKKFFSSNLENQSADMSFSFNFTGEDELDLGKDADTNENKIAVKPEEQAGTKEEKEIHFGELKLQDLVSFLLLYYSRFEPSPPILTFALFI